MAECETDEEGFVIDPITYERINPNRLIRFSQLGSDFCFDIGSLARDASVHRRYVNPINRLPLPQDIVDTIDRYNRSRTVPVIFHYTDTQRRQQRFSIHIEENIGSLILQVYRQIGRLQDIGKNDILYSGTDRTTSLYDYNLLDPITSLTPPGNIILSEKIGGDVGYRMHKLYEYGRREHIEWLTGIIPTEYRVPPPDPIPHDLMDQTIILDFAKMIRNNRGNFPNEYVIRGFTRLLSDAKISAQFANGLERALSGRINSTNNPDEQEKFKMLLHKLYSRVVDPYNLQEDGIQGLYRRSRWNPPTFQLDRSVAPVPEQPRQMDVLELLRAASRFANDEDYIHF